MSEYSNQTVNRMCIEFLESLDAEVNLDEVGINGEYFDIDNDRHMETLAELYHSRTNRRVHVPTIRMALRSVYLGSFIEGLRGD